MFKTLAAIVATVSVLTACAPLTPAEQQARMEYYARKDHSEKADFQQIQKVFNEGNDNNITGL